MRIRTIGLCVILLTTGCVGVKRTTPQPDAPQDEAVVVEPSTTHATGPGDSKTESPDGKTPATAAAEPARKQESAKPVPGKQQATPPLDLAALEKRLRETSAIGVFTKITLKNQIDDLLGQFRAYYQGRSKTNLTELRQQYDMLLLKVLTLLQDGDPSLARVVLASREVIWGILADPVKFATL